MDKISRIEYLQNKDDRGQLTRREADELERLENELLAHAKALSERN